MARPRPAVPAVAVGVVAALLLKLVSEAVILFQAAGTHGWQMARRSPALLAGVWNHWDAFWYTRIAEHGYPSVTHVQIGPVAIFDGSAFMPVYPFAMRAVTRLSGVNSVDAGVIVSAICLPLALVATYRLIELDLGQGRALAALALMLTWPASFFFAGIYSESTQLLFVATAFLAARRQWWLVAGALTAAATMTKLFSVILVPCLVLEAYMVLRPSLLRVASATLLLGVPPALALAGWALYFQWRFHEPIRFLTSQQSFRRHLALPWVPVGTSLAGLLQGRLYNDHGLLPFMELGTYLLILATIPLVARRLRLSYALFMALFLLVVGSQMVVGGGAPEALQSIARYALAVIPLFAGLAMLLHRRLLAWIPVLALFGWLWVYTLGRFVTDQWSG